MKKRRQLRVAIGGVGVIGALLAMASLGGCSSSRSAPEKQIVDASQFRLGSDAAIERGLGAPDAAGHEHVGEMADFSGGMIATMAESDLRTPDDVTVLTGPPVDLEARRAMQAERAQVVDPIADEEIIETTYVVDALVGQINGRPVIASEFFAPMAARFQRQALEMPAEEWVQVARSRIHDELTAQTVDQLLLAEFEASLTPQEKAGLLAFIQRLRESLISGNFGSEARAKRVLEEQGTTFEEKVKEDRDKQLIQEALMSAIRDKIWVTWREVQQEYERRFEEFNSAGSFKIRVVQIPASDMERKRLVETAIEEEESFEDIALKWNDLRRSQGGLFEGDLDAPTYAESRIFGPDPLNDAALQLTVGEVSEVFEFNGKLYWMYLEELQESAISLREAQLMLFNEIRGRRMRVEQAKYLQQLFEHGSITDMKQMENELLQYAVDRFIAQSDG